MNPSLSSIAEPIRREVEILLEQSADKFIDKGRLREAVKYALLQGGKRIRPLLTYAAADACGQRTDFLTYAAAAVETIHAYSLVHDDLPSMDDDDLRRGKPTTHIAFDEATAVLAGDALQGLAFELLANAPGSDNQIVQSIACLSQAAGGRGMVEGQMRDIEQVGAKPNIEELRAMHLRKTGALIQASLLLGGISAGNTDAAKTYALKDFAQAIGLAFQVRDDIIDQISSTEVLGKTQGADQALDKPNYVDLLGLEAAQVELKSLHQSAIEALEIFGDRASTLHLISDFVVERLH